MHNKTIAELHNGLQDKQFSSRELTEHYLKRIKQYNDKINCYVTIDEAGAIAAAKQADKALQAGSTNALTGIPIAHKDLFCTQGIKTSCASKMLDNFIAPYDASLVKQLKQAGIVMLGKLNMDEFAMGSSNENSFYGPVKNPWDLQRVPGGSSGGSAAAVAAGLAAATTGTDTGGSIRQPAALCGITGLKPTYGRVSRFGMVAFASSLDQAGPMTKSAEDAAFLLNAMAGFDEKDSTSVNKEVPDYRATLNDSLRGLKIGIPHEFFNQDLDSQIAKPVETAIEELVKLGANVKEISLPHNHLSIPVYYVIAPAECSSNLSRFDGIRFGHRCEDAKDLNDLYCRSRSEGFGAEVKRRIMIGTYALSAGYYDAYYLKAQKIRRLIRDDFMQAFADVDVIAGPTAPSPAFKIGEKAKDPISMYLSDIYTIAANLAGLPALSVPAGFSNKLPVGLQLIGNYWQEPLLLNIGHQFQQVTDHHLQQPSEVA